MVMQTIHVGLGRLYNASACSNLGRDEILLPFPLGVLLQKLQAKIECYRGVLKDRHILKARIGAAISSMNNH
jgi:hypothetical protein